MSGFRRRWAPILAATVLLGCGPEEDTSCSSHSDCFQGELCIDGSCQSDPDAPTNNGANNGANSGANNPIANNPTSNNGVNNGANNGGTANNGMISTGVCLVDPFTSSCDVPDDNDDFSDYVKMVGDCGDESCGLPGCSEGWDDFVGGEVDIEAMQLCALESRDRYNTNLIPCDNKSFVVEATMKPRQDCDPDLYTFNMAIQGYDCTKTIDDSTMMQRVRCEELPDGSKKITAFVTPSISIASAYFTVEERAADNVHFDYDINILVRE